MSIFSDREHLCEITRLSNEDWSDTGEKSIGSLTGIVSLNSSAIANNVTVQDTGFTMLPNGVVSVYYRPSSWKPVDGESIKLGDHILIHDLNESPGRTSTYIIDSIDDAGTRPTVYKCKLTARRAS